MSETQPPTITEGATTGDISDTVADPQLSQDSAVQRGLSGLECDSKDVDSAANSVNHGDLYKVVDKLSINEKKPEVKKAPKIELADINLLVRDLLVTSGGINSTNMCPD